VVKELPYQVNKANLVENIARLVDEKKLSEISEVRDESDREGIRIVLELKEGLILSGSFTTFTSVRRWRPALE